MLKKKVGLYLLGVCVAAVPMLIQAQDGRAVVNAVARAMGVENLKTIQLSGTGSNAGVGQNISPSLAWPLVRVKSYTRQIDLDAVSSAVQMVRIQNNADQTQSQVIPPNAPWAQQFDIWVTPFGFIKGALANNTTVRSETVSGVRYNVVSYTLQNKYKVEGYINDQNMVERVRTWVDNNVLGDMLVEGVYTDYKDFSGVKVPTFMTVKQGGFPVLILGVNDVKANVPVTIQAGQAPAAPQPVTVASEKIVDGVYYLKGGTHHSVAVEFADHIVVIEGPQNEQRSLAVLAEVKKLFPAKPLRYLVNTHHHFDHSGGLRTYVDAGVTIVTNDINKDFYEKAFVAPRTLNPDRLEQSKKKPVIEITGDKKVMSDSMRTLELHLVKTNVHNDGMLMAYLPKEKILVEVDMYTPPAPDAAAAVLSAPVNPNSLSLVDNLEKLRLDFETILPLHGPGKVTRTDLYAFVRKPMLNISDLPDPNVAPPAVPRVGRGGRGGGGGEVATVAAPGSPQALLTNVCTACHNLERVESKKLDRQAWQTIVTRMKGRGAVLTDEQVGPLVDYLFQTHGQ